MRKILYLGVCFIILFYSCDAESSTSEKVGKEETLTFEGASEAEVLGIATLGQSYIVAGDIDLDSDTGAALLFSTDGEKINWTRTYTNNSMHNWFDGVTIDKDGNAIAVGASYSSSTKSDVIVSKVDADGNEVWTKVFGGNGTDRAMDVVELENGYLVAGATWSAGHGDADVFFMLLDKQGALQYVKMLGSTGYDYFDGNIVVFEDGSFAGSGRTSYFVSQNDDVNAWVIKFSSTGAVEWQKSYTATGWEQAEGIALAPDGNLIVGAISNGAPGASEEDSNWGWWLLKVKATDGSVMWQNFIDPKGSSEWLYDIAVDENGDILAIGDTWAYNWEPYRESIMLRKINNDNGAVIWQKYYSRAYHYELPESIIVNPNGGYVAAGSSTDESTNNIEGILQYFRDSGQNSIFIDVANNTTNKPAYSESSTDSTVITNPTMFSEISRNLLQEKNYQINFRELN